MSKFNGSYRCFHVNTKTPYRIISWTSTSISVVPTVLSKQGWNIFHLRKLNLFPLQLFQSRKYVLFCPCMVGVSCVDIYKWKYSIATSSILIMSWKCLIPVVQRLGISACNLEVMDPTPTRGELLSISDNLVCYSLQKKYILPKTVSHITSWKLSHSRSSTFRAWGSWVRAPPRVSYFSSYKISIFSRTVLQRIKMGAAYRACSAFRVLHFTHKSIYMSQTERERAGVFN